jgi:hypothetical protein
MRRAVYAVLCGLVVTGAGCGEDETLTQAETSAEIGRICDAVEAKGQGLNGDPRNDAPILKAFVPAYEQALDDFRGLDVHEDLTDERDDFVDLGERQLPLMQEAQALAERGDARAYRAKVGEIEALDAENDDIATRLGATECAR